MIVLGGVKVGYVIHCAALLASGTILTCYGLALRYGHVKLWPAPMISDCAVKPPEMFLFRLGIVTAAMLMALQSVIVFLAAAPRSKAALVFGVTACLALAVVGVVNEDEASTVHSSESCMLWISSPSQNMICKAQVT